MTTTKLKPRIVHRWTDEGDDQRRLVLADRCLVDEVRTVDAMGKVAWAMHESNVLTLDDVACLPEWSLRLILDGLGLEPQHLSGFDPQGDSHE